MKKALLAALCFVLVSLLLVSGPSALTDPGAVFTGDFNGLAGGFSPPQSGGAVDVTLVSQSENQMIYPGGSATRISYVQNNGPGAAYFRLVYAIQYEADSWDKIGVSFVAEPGFVEHEWRSIYIDDTPYLMKTFTYTQALASGEASSQVIITLALDDDISTQQLKRYRSDFLQIQTLAIASDTFAGQTALEALDQAMPLDTLNPF